MSNTDDPEFGDQLINRWMITVDDQHFGPWYSQARAEHEAHTWNAAHATSGVTATVVFLHGRNVLAAYQPQQR